MPLINRELFVDVVKKSPNLLQMGFMRFNLSDPKDSQKSAIEALDQMRGYLMNGGFMDKRWRPWDLSVESLKHLDPKQSWWGFEFETGWKSRDARAQAVAFSWDNFDGVTYDSEGEGGYPVEITFVPSNRSSFADGTAPALRFTQWMNDNPQLVNRTGVEHVGTHWNFSHPNSRKDQYKNRALALFLNCSLKWLMQKNGDRAIMFGRETLYGVCYAREGGGSNWVECKGFRTTYDSKEFSNYINTAEALNKAADLFLSLDTATQAEYERTRVGVSNLYDVAFNGAKPVVSPVENLKIASGAATLSARDHWN